MTSPHGPHARKGTIDPMTETPPPAGRGRAVWVPAGLGLLALIVTGWVILTRLDVLRSGHPAYAVLVGTVAALGLALLARAWRSARSVERPAYRRIARLGKATAATLFVLLVAATGWLRPLPASDLAVRAMAGTPTVTVTDSASTITLTPRTPTQDGLVFQPGAKVDPRAYLPLLTRVAQEGHLVVIVKQPLGIGFLAGDAPRGIIAAHPEVTRWTVAGHSLGGVVASSYGETYAGRCRWPRPVGVVPPRLARRSARLARHVGVGLP